jgi:hypothetical protein
LAAAYAENGRFTDAIETAQRAVQLATAQGDFALANKLEKDLDLYRANYPLRHSGLAECALASAGVTDPGPLLPVVALYPDLMALARKALNEVKTWLYVRTCAT